MCLAYSSPVFEAVAPQGARTEKGVTIEDVQQVHALIETCLHRNMTMEEACATLAQLGVDRRFTALVWRRLEAENPEFFSEYNAKLITVSPRMLINSHIPKN